MAIFIDKKGESGYNFWLGIEVDELDWTKFSH
jgi:hypothetical protein